ncbi:MAG: FAD-dependent oxidoreductase [Armatimonadota bacterium]|nr:FAD-dependent oxidoreductase [Armatimonadota bacterium]MDR5675915.1 FAD-dependent oxidoreductase [Armatimonadota bacterium]MDR5688892.1 FAD-dependent oxidoreductase [Armatimonadota bacterium]MDR7390004.1 FAD-dependent oxidoreductase [Armatimonadota bacterium]MDR7392723.1 FAD-dependent oxidoreductase [Armatimonadota bacterium]
MANDAVLVVGGGPAGLEAARGAADLGARVVLVEERDHLGGTPIFERYAALTHGFQDAEEVMERLTREVTTHPNVQVRLLTRVVGCEGSAGDFRVRLAKVGDGTSETVHVGSIVVATGFQHFDPGRETQVYGYYEYPDVITLVEAEAMLKAKRFVRPSTGQPPERVCFIQCVGSRDRQIGNEYCSKVCCGIASKQAIEIRQQVPNCKVYIFYIDMRMYGYWENEIYWPAQEQYKVQYIKGIATEIIQKGDKLLVRGEDTTLGRPMEVLMDMVILSVGMEPSKGTREVARVLGLKQNKYGFIEVPHEGLDPVATSVPGIFVAGAAAGPKDLDDTLSMAGAAAMKAVATVRRAAASPAG